MLIVGQYNDYQKTWKKDFNLNYKISCLAFMIPVALIILNVKKLSHCVNEINWKVWFSFLLITSFFSYQNDVNHWGEKYSLWEISDYLFAIVNLYYVLKLIFCLFRSKEYFAGYLLIFGVLLSFISKIKSLKVYKENNKKLYMFYHSLWHYFMPLVSVFVIFSIIKV